MEKVFQGENDQLCQMFLKLGFIIDHLLVKVVIGENCFSGVVGIKVN